MAFLRNWLFTILFFAGLILSLPAFATIIIESVTGSSHWEKEDGNFIVYGGFAGSEAPSDCTVNADGTCDNCSVSLKACNKKRVRLESELRISLRSDSAKNSGPLIITTSDGNTQIGQAGDVVGKNVAGSVGVTWSTLCSGATGIGISNCVSTASPSSVASLMIGVDEDNDGKLSSSEGDTFSLKVHRPNNADTIGHCDDTTASFTDGICAFTTIPGDKKIFIEDLRPTSTFPNSGNMQFESIRFFHSTTGFTGGKDGANPGSQFYIDIKIEVEGDEYFLAKNNVDELSNGSVYFFRISMVDYARNVAFITSNEAISFACDKAASSLAANSTDDANCQFMAEPDKVTGLLSEDVNCLIATAASGSHLSNHLKTFRSFRRQLLLTRKWGQGFVRSYYRHGSYMARWIEKHSWSKPVVRTLLWPLWAWAYLTLKLDWISASLIFIFSLSLIIFLGRNLLLRKHQYETTS